MKKITIYQCRKGVIIEEADAGGVLVLSGGQDCEGAFSDEDLSAAVTRIVRNWREPSDRLATPRS